MWWAVLLGPVLGAAITAGALTFQQWRTDVRETERRASARKHELDRLDTVHREARAERWRDQRFTVYSELLATTKAITEAGRALIGLVERFDDGENVHTQVDEIRALEDALKALVAQVSLVGSDVAREAATSLESKVTMFSVRAFLADYRGDVNINQTLQHLQGTLGGVREGFQQMIEAARSDLGTP